MQREQLIRNCSQYLVAHYRYCAKTDVILRGINIENSNENSDCDIGLDVKYCSEWLEFRLRLFSAVVARQMLRRK